ncbi:alanine dehydrogenase [Myxococcota bacterium]|nr:alanine dehydrogenase [Myxococcota bacterium]
MVIGVPAEITAFEGRVALTPTGARALTRAGHTVLVQQGAGDASGLTDDDYVRAGAELVPTPEEVWGRAGLIWKVQAPQAAEWPLMRQGQVLVAFLHLAANQGLHDALRRAGVTAIATELVTDERGGRPLLTPMSEIAGRLAVQAGAMCLSLPHGGRGLLLGGATGVAPARTLILGGGVVGEHAATAALGAGSDVVVMDLDLPRLRELSARTGGRARTLFASPSELERALGEADLVIGAALIPGARTPRLIRREALSFMKPGAAIVDVAVDQGGVAETTRPTNYGDPCYLVDGVVHYAVPNLPGVVPRTATFALENVSLPYAARLAERGPRSAPGLAQALVVADGEPVPAANRGR